jgi:hypothetical protein
MGVVTKINTITNPGRSTPCLTCVRNLDECRDTCRGKTYKTAEPDCYVQASKNQPTRKITAKPKRQQIEAVPMVA